MKNISDKDTFEKREEKKLFIETYGCQMNVADSEVVASIMQMAGYTLCDTIEDSDAIFVNTCSCLLYTSPSPRDGLLSRMPSSA